MFNIISDIAILFNSAVSSYSWTSWMINFFCKEGSSVDIHTKQVLKLRHPILELLHDIAAITGSVMIGVFACSLGLSLDEAKILSVSLIRAYNVVKANMYIENLIELNNSQTTENSIQQVSHDKTPSQLEDETIEKISEKPIDNAIELINTPDCLVVGDNIDIGGAATA